VPVARAILIGNQIKADVTLDVAKAHDVDQGWLDQLRPETAAEPVQADHESDDD